MTGPDAAAEAVRTALGELAPPGVTTGVLPVDARHVLDLHDSERSVIEGAVAKRQREFATGRALLRLLVGEPVEIPMTSSRAPRLPDGLIGTLCHDPELAAAAIAPAEVAGSLGVDLERTGPLTAGESAVIVRPDEAGLDPRLVFVLKEAAYKAWSGLGGRLLDFHDVRVAITADRFSATVVRDSTTLDGRFAEAGGRWLALVVAGPPTG